MTRRTKWNPNPRDPSPAEKVLMYLEADWEARWRSRYWDLLGGQLPGHIDNDEINNDPIIRSTAQVAHFINCVWDDCYYTPLSRE